MSRSFVSQILHGARSVLRALVPASLRRLFQPVLVILARRRVMSAIAAGELAFAPGPLVVSGLFNETKGVSRAARLTAQGLAAAGLMPIRHDLRPVLSAGIGADASFPSDRPGGAWVIHLNAPEAIQALASMDPAGWLGRVRIGYWAYELPRVPKSWVKVSKAFHEIWAPSQFVVDALLASGVDVPVRVMPHPVLVEAAFPIPADEKSGFVVLAMGDLRSSAVRKNLVGAIEIYKRAFPAQASNQKLVLKVQSEDAYPRFRSTADAAIADRTDIELLSEHLDDNKTRKLVASSSVILSPHRSEGFGLVLAEAFAVGVPAIATSWSGNLDFMRDMPELLIKFSLVSVRDSAGVYTDGSLQWAEPDVDDAAKKLRTLAASPDLRARLAARGRSNLERQLEAWRPADLERTALGTLVTPPAKGPDWAV